MRPSTWAGTPEIMCVGGFPSRSGQFLRTSSWLPPMPPEVTITMGALSSKSPVSSRLLDWPRAQESGGEHLAGHADDGARRGHELVDAVAEARDRPGRARRAAARAARTARPRRARCPTRCGSAARSCRARSRRSRRARPSRPWGRGARPAPAARRASRRRRSPRRPRPSGAATRPRGGRTPPCPSQSCQRELVRVLDAQPALLGGVDEEEPAEGPEGLAAERRLGLLVEQRDPPAGVRPARRSRPARPARRRRRWRRIRHS